jgi:hypothetical protein
MPLQNRVTPFGEILAVPERGLVMGNRGIIHDPGTRRLLNRRWATKAWITCLCAFRGVRRDVMARRSWTELFFLDEATALAAGHRPCFFCRRDAAIAFRTAWAAGNGCAPPKACEMDERLHGERLIGRRKRLHALPAPLAELPDGAMVAGGDASFLVVGGAALRWTPAGYRAGAPPMGEVQLLTPPSTLRALAAGYRAALHPSTLSPKFESKGRSARPPAD